MTVDRDAEWAAALSEHAARLAADFRAIFGRFALTLDQMVTLPESDLREMIGELVAELRKLAEGS